MLSERQRAKALPELALLRQTGRLQPQALPLIQKGRLQPQALPLIQKGRLRCSQRQERAGTRRRAEQLRIRRINRSMAVAAAAVAVAAESAAAQTGPPSRRMRTP